jgi:hypothetical protein
LGALRGTPDLFWHIVSTDTATLAVADMPLLLLIIGNLVAWLVLWRREEMWLSLGSILGALAYNVTNGTPSGFRYEIPALPFLVLCFAALVARCAGLSPREWLGARPVDTVETGRQAGNRSGQALDGERVGAATSGEPDRRHGRRVDGDERVRRRDESATPATTREPHGVHQPVRLDPDLREGPG